MSASTRRFARHYAVMLPAMLVAMLLRRAEYTHHHSAEVVA